MAVLSRKVIDKIIEIIGLENTHEWNGMASESWPSYFMKKFNKNVTHLWQFAFILFYKRMQDTIIIGESDYEIQFQFLVDLIGTESHSPLLTFDC